VATRLPTRRLIGEAIARHLPGFEAVEAPRAFYWYRSPARADWLTGSPPGQPTLHRLVSVCHSAKEAVFSVDLYTGLRPTWNRNYGGHLLASASGLPNVRLDSGGTPVQETVYPYDGSEAGAVEALERIGRELQAHAVGWFAKKKEEARTDPLARHARAWLVRRWAELPDDVADQLERAVAAAGGQPWDVAFPLIERAEGRAARPGLGAGPAARGTDGDLAPGLGPVRLRATPPAPLLVLRAAPASDSPPQNPVLTFRVPAGS
jgi:hypothetical protein